MPINLGQLSNVASGATSLANLVLVTPQKLVGYQPQNAPSYKKDTSTPPPTILFNYEGEQSAQLQSDVTDHYTEDNSTIQDQIAKKPIIITTQGFVGELNDIAPAALAPIKVIADKLVDIGAYAPGISATAALAYAEAFQAYQVGAAVANAAIQTWSSINGGSKSDGQGVIDGSDIVEGSANAKTQTQQQIYFQQFYGYWNRRQLFTVQTPWAVFKDMVIMDIKATQDADTRMISTFSLTLKQMRFASSFVTGSTLDASNFQTRGSASASPETDLGTNTLTPSATTFDSQVA